MEWKEFEVNDNFELKIITVKEIIKSDKVYNALIEGLKFDKVSLGGIEFNECHFKGIDFTSAEVEGLVFIDCIFEGCDLSNLNLSRKSLIRSRFINCRLVGISIDKQTLHNVLFDNCNLKYANFADNKFKNVMFKKCNIDDGRFCENKFEGMFFEDVSMRNIEIFKCSLSAVDLSTSIIDGIKINPSELFGVIVNYNQALLLSKILGIIIKEE